MIVVRAPFRFPIGGGGTDLPSYYSKYGGHLLTAAINRYMFLNINTPACIRHISIKYSKTETVEDVREIKHDLVRETLLYLGFQGPIEISSMADASAGTGLGSSGAYTVALLKGMNTLMQRYVDKETLAKEACHIEMVRVGSPVGKQDQYASALGGIFAMKIAEDGEVETQSLDLDRDFVTELQYRLLMFYTDIQRSANDVLQEQKMKVLNDESNTVSAMHEIKDIGYRIEQALKSGDIDEFGRLMHQHWKVKKAVSSKMSTPSIDYWYSLAMQHGALGGKIMGAGGGGFFVFCCEEGRRKELLTVMRDAGLTHMNYGFDFEGAKVLVDF